MKNPKTAEGQHVKTSETEKLLSLVKYKDDKIHIAYGKFFVTHETFETFEKAEEYIKQKPLELILCCVGAYLDYEKNEKKQ